MNNNNTFAGKVALVTGGTSGIGKATALAEVASTFTGWSLGYSEFVD